MIVVDIETSGLNFEKCGIWQIGAVDLDKPENTFLEEARIDDEDFIINSVQSERTVFEVIGKTEEELREISKQSQRDLITNFFNWAKKVNINNCICQNPQFDLGFIFSKARKYNLEIPFHSRAIDLHSIAQIRYFDINKKFLIKEEKNCFGMGLTEILNFCGMKDNRDVHNALEDAKLTAECFSRIVYGKKLFSEYNKFEIPDYLK